MLHPAVFLIRNSGNQELIVLKAHSCILLGLLAYEPPANPTYACKVFARAPVTN
jgi:hypothetical protein